LTGNEYAIINRDNGRTQPPAAEFILVRCRFVPGADAEESLLGFAI
jgi:hypothetical protein